MDFDCLYRSILLLVVFFLNVLLVIKAEAASNIVICGFNGKRMVFPTSLGIKDCSEEICPPLKIPSDSYSNCHRCCYTTNSNHVHGNWSSWKMKDSCSASCGNGQQLYYRTCTNPSPLGNGMKCKNTTGQDAMVEMKFTTCHITSCPADSKLVIPIAVFGVLTPVLIFIVVVLYINLRNEKRKGKFHQDTFHPDAFPMGCTDNNMSAFDVDMSVNNALDKDDSDAERLNN